MKVLDLSVKSKVKGVRHFNEEINQLYHPLGKFDQDSQDIIYSKDTASQTKFLPILIKEWFYLLKGEGYLVIDYVPNEFCDFKKLENNMWNFWQGKYDILFHGPISSSELKDLTTKSLTDFIKDITSKDRKNKIDSNYFRFICKKLEVNKKENDDITKWTFGIITKGDRDDWLEEIIQSIKNQGIPNYEVIICGTYRRRKENNFKYIPFSDRDDKGWITKKKNLIVKEAKYENICILHDRIILNNDWYKGMKKYGNSFELLCNKQTTKNDGIRAGDWLTYGNSKVGLPYKISKLSYTDWDEYIYISGQLTITKKSILIKCPWNETLYWGQEDVELTFRAKDLGYIPRFNPYSSCIALTWRFGDLPVKYYRSQGLIPKDMLVRRFMRVLAKLIFSIPFTPQIFALPHRLLLQTSFYKYVIHH